MSKSYGLLTLAGTLLVPGKALAHSPIEGINSFSNGLLHPVLVPAHLLLLIAVGVFIGQQGVKDNHIVLLSFVAANIVGLIAAWFSLDLRLGLLVTGCAAVFGLLIAVKPVVGLLLKSVIAGMAGFVIGADSTQEALAGTAKMMALIGCAVGINFFILYPMALADYFKNKKWQEIGVRVIGSWVAAISFLMLALM